MYKVKTVSANESFDLIKTIIEEDGCIVLENALSDDMLQKLTDELSVHLDDTQKCQGDFYGYETKRLSGLFTKAPATREMAIHPVVLKVMDHFLLPACDDYQINLTQAIQIGSKEIQQVPHRDDSMFPYDKGGHEAMINCMWAVSDFTKENGATHLVPGSHKWEDKELLPQVEEITQGEMRAGSVLIYLGSLIHNGGANITTMSRTGVVISYCNGWLRQAENQYLAVPLKEAASFPERLQRLMGYFVHKPNLGSVEGQDPITLLRNEAESDGLFTEFLPEEVKPKLKEFREQLSHAA